MSNHDILDDPDDAFAELMAEADAALAAELAKPAPSPDERKGD